MSDREREDLEYEKRTIVRRLFKSSRQGIVTGTSDGDDVIRIGIVNRLLDKLTGK
jgi:hypothetical protein